MESTKISKLNDEIKLFPYLGKLPKIAESVFLASGSKIIGDVTIGEDSSVWYNTVIRGDVHYITIGNMTNIQDCSMLHVTNNMYPLIIGDKVTIGHSVTLHGCTLEDLCLIGMGAVILDGAIVKKNSLVAAGTVVKPGFIVPSGTLVAGVPGKIVRELNEKEILDFEASANRYKKYTELTVQSFNEFFDN
ncbi:MAG: gamma carbonic anhydrase family protein [Ignavibacteria bacterium]|jgi:carbonic anhydrase/acetyltransferase-like protein (isoleucine patch superfamily)|nr:gamma carbonic anhydrase family protein [Ignavibacteria bacterium]MDP3831044.1 gamma carbonic anhydrase family protein [Ignavibacteriaceae bacterium]